MRLSVHLDHNQDHDHYCLCKEIFDMESTHHVALTGIDTNRSNQRTG